MAGDLMVAMSPDFLDDAPVRVFVHPHRPRRML
jgi:hypothetical protein